MILLIGIFGEKREEHDSDYKVGWFSTSWFPAARSSKAIGAAPDRVEIIERLIIRELLKHLAGWVREISIAAAAPNVEKAEIYSRKIGCERLEFRFRSR